MAFNFVLSSFPNVTQIDLTGPLQVLHRLPDPSAHRRQVAQTRRQRLRPEPGAHDHVATCEPLDLLCVPGGFGVSEAIANADTIDFVRRQAARAKYVTSVCTGRSCWEWPGC